MVKMKKVVKDRELQEMLLKGRSGKGAKNNYKSFCKSCFTEYMIEIPNCTHCKKETITFEVSY